MLQLEAPPSNLPLGEVWRACWSSDAAETQVRLIVRHGPLLFPKPAISWTRGAELTFLPEAPGDYELLVQWRTEDGRRGHVAAPLRVEHGGSGEIAGPALASVGRGLWAPSAWEAVLLEGAEHVALDLLDELLEPGGVAYDVGANLGLYALRIAERVGGAGRVYCIEANPVCVWFLQANLLRSGAANAEILPFALLDEHGHVPFTIHYGNANLGVSAPSGFYPQKPGHEIQVESIAFDDLVEEYSLRPPDVVKIDVEGAEARVLQGMVRTLESRRPRLLLELHGFRAASACLTFLEGHGYHFLELGPPRRSQDAQATLGAHGDTVYQIAALPESESSVALAAGV
jgi:FkbM family methyltransferase